MGIASSAIFGRRVRQRLVRSFWLALLAPIAVVWLGAQQFVPFGAQNQQRL